MIERCRCSHAHSSETAICLSLTGSRSRRPCGKELSSCPPRNPPTSTTPLYPRFRLRHTPSFWRILPCFGWSVQITVRRFFLNVTVYLTISSVFSYLDSPTSPSLTNPPPPLPPPPYTSSCSALSHLRPASAPPSPPSAPSPHSPHNPEDMLTRYLQLL